jgi:hypothetical protein
VKVVGGHAGEEGDRPGALARVFDQQRLAKCIAVGRQDGVAHLLHAGIDAADDGYPAQDLLAPGDELAADEVAGQHAGREYDQQREDGAEAGNVVTDEDPRVPALREQRQALVHGAHDQAEHPERDADGDPEEQAGDEVAL